MTNQPASAVQVAVRLDDSGRVVLVAPWNDYLPARAKALGGRWDPQERSWRFSARDEYQVRLLALELYGTDGRTSTALVTVRLDLSVQGAVETPRVVVAGRTIAERRWRDSEVRLADDVILTSGGFAPTGGTRRHPAIGRTDAVLEVRGVPRPAALREGLDILDEQASSREALLAERARLTARLAEIDALLGP